MRNLDARRRQADFLTVLRSLGPFVDCTSNQVISILAFATQFDANEEQVIAVKELSKPEHDQLVSESIRKAKDLHCRRIHLDITLEELAVDIMVG